MIRTVPRIDSYLPLNDLHLSPEWTTSNPGIDDIKPRNELPLFPELTTSNPEIDDIKPRNEFWGYKPILIHDLFSYLCPSVTSVVRLIRGSTSYVSLVIHLCIRYNITIQLFSTLFEAG